MLHIFDAHLLLADEPDHQYSNSNAEGELAVIFQMALQGKLGVYHSAISNIN